MKTGRGGEPEWCPYVGCMQRWGCGAVAEPPQFLSVAKQLVWFCIRRVRIVMLCCSRDGVGQREICCPGREEKRMKKNKAV